MIWLHISPLLLSASLTKREAEHSSRDTLCFHFVIRLIYFPVPAPSSEGKRAKSAWRSEM